MSKDMITRKLEAAKQEISDMQKKLNTTIKEPKQTVNMVPAGVQEVGEDTNKIEEKIPGFITGGPRTSKKMKEV
tara:strand:- start:788 stop:1009 length:222 start_codon:yes stop_codon:yes gene_type:complete